MIFVSATKIYVIMSKTSIINVQGIDISITRYNQDDYICLTDMVKANYQIQTSAIKNYVLPQKSKLIKNEWIYADEADMLNIIMFNCTAKEWRELNKERVLSGENIRDMAKLFSIFVAFYFQFLW